MALTSAQQARNLYAGLIRGGRPPEEVERARLDLEYAKARQAADTWRAALSPAQRMQLAVRLLSGDDNAPG
jgi:hypothetical protein